jgi:hypothetical protein
MDNWKKDSKNSPYTSFNYLSLELVNETCHGGMHLIPLQLL